MPSVSASPTVPTSVYVCRPVAVITSTWLPISRSLSSAVALSMATSSGPLGARPWRSSITSSAVAVPRRAEHRCAAGGDGVAVGVDDLGAALDVALGALDSRHRRDRVDEIGRDRVAGAEVAGFAEGERGADLEVGLLVRRAEQRVEPGAHAVGEHERADDERDAEDDRDGDRDQAPDARPDAAARQQQCGVATHGDQSPIRFKRSSTASASGRASRRRCGRR